MQYIDDVYDMGEEAFDTGISPEFLGGVGGIIASAGGGGVGSSGAGAAGAGTVNLGGGGGGGNFGNTYTGQAGGSGLVILRYKFQ